MLKPYNSIIIIFLIIFSFLSVDNFFLRSLPEYEYQSKEPFVAACDSTNLVEMDYFPVDLDRLFFADNYTAQRERLNFLGNETYGFIVTPWGGHFISTHIEGNTKLYFNSYGRQEEIHVPQAGIVETILIENGTLAMKNGHEIMLGMTLHLDLGSDCGLGFGHMDLLKSIYDEFQLGGTVHLTANQLMGYTHNSSDWSGLDFYYWHDGSICPYVAFNAELKVQYEYYFNLQYETCKLSGVFPEANICNDLDVSIENTVWGVWQYDHGPYDDLFNEAHDVGLYDFEFVDFFNINKTNPETFHKDPRNMTQDLPEDVVGLFTDNSFGLGVPGYNWIGVSLAKLVTGNYQDGIIKVFPYYPNGDWGVDSIHIKYVINEHSAGPQDDVLQLEYFIELVDALMGFTSNNMTFIRYGFFDSTEEGLLISIQFLLMVPLVFIVIVRIRKYKK
ncbi:MAG: hypothetical protein JXA54_11745 [Candidatus Heimdallarchaeota archaeon]|nr:hypothetical protein [Candidatus Heimdallarchaeota archaeon]